MATTLRLLSTYKGFKPQDIITIEDDAIAAQLLQGGVNATANLTGGTVAYQPAPFVGSVPEKVNFPLPRTVRAGQRDTFVVSAGVTLSLTSSTDIVGSREVLANDGTVNSTTALASGATTIGPYTSDTNVRLSVRAGTVSTAVVPTAAGTGSGGTGSLGPMVAVPAGSTNFVLKGAGNGAIGDRIVAIKYIVTGAATTVTLTDGDGTAYPDPSGNPGLIPNPFNAKQILGPNAVAPDDLQMYGQPSYNGPWKVTTGDNVALEVYGEFS